MARTHRTTWQKFEKRVAAFFHTKRQRSSGGSADYGDSDSQHDAIYIEAKLRAKSAIHTLFAETERRAQKERKIPILALQLKNHTGWLLVCRPSDIHALSGYARNEEETPMYDSLADTPNANW